MCLLGSARFCWRLLESTEVCITLQGSAGPVEVCWGMMLSAGVCSDLLRFAGVC